MIATGGVPRAVRRDLRAAVRDTESLVDVSDVAEVAQHLYGAWYLGGRPQGSSSGEAGHLRPLDLHVLDALRHAHADFGRWDGEWSVTAVPGAGHLTVTRSGENRVVSRADVIPSARHCLPPRPGDLVRVAAWRETVDPARGFWQTYGGDWDAAQIPSGLVRFYWNVPWRSTPSLVGSVSNRLGRAGCSYALKVAVEDRHVERPDRGVVYLSAENVGPAMPAMRAAYDDLRRKLGTRTPRLTRRLADGLAVAEDPDSGESFGEHRCRVVAVGLAAARRESALGVDEHVAMLIEHLRSERVDPRAPHLRPGSTADYRW